MAELNPKAVEAAIYAWGHCNVDDGVRYPVPIRMKIAIEAAEPHLKRQHFEEFAEGLREAGQGAPLADFIERRLDQLEQSIGGEDE